MTRVELDEFTLSYVECALWSSTDEDGEPLDSSYFVDDIAPETLAAMVADCKDFQDSFGELIADDVQRAGHDFWLTRNGHGAGFWDGGYPDEMECEDPETGTWGPDRQYPTLGDYLTAMAKPYGSYDLYLGDDGMIHGQ